MLDQISDYHAGRLGLVALVRNLHVEANPRDAGVRNQFEVMWSPIGAEHELRTEPWAPPGSASDETLARALDAFAEWVTGVLTANSAPEHG